MNAEQNEDLQYIRQLIFSAVDLNLYLDTHPDDRDALEVYNHYAMQLRDAVDAYDKKYGPLCNFGMGMSGHPWQWINEPWPWSNM